MIDAHRAAFKAEEAECRVEDQLDKMIPAEKRRTSLVELDVKIIETDDPRWIDHVKKYLENTLDVERLAGELLSTNNLSIAGAIALLAYANEHMDAGGHWPDDMESGDKIGSWTYFMNAAVADALRRTQGA